MGTEQRAGSGNALPRAITALTAQDTCGVHAIAEVDPAFIAKQIEVVLADIGADCIKTGMLHRAEVIEVVVATLQGHAAGVPLVVDPVMVAKGGAVLLDPATVGLLKDRLLPMATVLTPNIPEAVELVGGPIESVADMKDAARRLAALGPEAVLVKGGHRRGPDIVDVLVFRGELVEFSSPRIDTRHTHGTG